MIKTIIKALDKPLGLYILPYMERGVVYRSSHPTNLPQALRLFLARGLILGGYRLLLKNGKTWIETS